MTPRETAHEIYKTIVMSQRNDEYESQTLNQFLDMVTPIIEEAERAAYRAGADAMRLIATQEIGVAMDTWGASGSYRDFGSQLIDAIDALPLPEPPR